MALRSHVGISIIRFPDRSWRRRPGRPRIKWSDQLRDTPYNTLGDLFAVVTVVERRDSPRRLRDSDDDDDDDCMCTQRDFCWAIAVPSVTRCRCRGHRCAGGVRQ